MTYTTPLENENINSLEKAKFEQLADLIYVRTKGSGTFVQQTITDPNDGLGVTHKTVTDIPVRFPLIGQSINPIRNTISILNSDEFNSIYFHIKSTFTAGWVEGQVKGPQKIGPGETFNTPCGNNVYIWIACENGKTAKVYFGEFA